MMAYDTTVSSANDTMVSLANDTMVSSANDPTVSSANNTTVSLANDTTVSSANGTTVSSANNTTVSSANDTTVSSTNNISSEILTFLKEGEGQLAIGKYKEVTLVLGPTGAGKSTLTQFLTGNDDTLSAVEAREGGGEYIIVDSGNNVCQGTIDSCTIYPTLFTDKETDSGYYDCPGFGDTRSVKHDIAVTYFIKKVIDSVDSVKLLFTVSFHSVREGVDRDNFVLFLKNVATMVKNLEKFQNGVALVVTKVENNFIRNKKKEFVMVSDEAVISNVAQFLEKVKLELYKKVKMGGGSVYEDTIKLVDNFLKKDGDDYSRISLFRRPDEEGPINESSLLQEGKTRLKKILNTIEYIPINSQDFGYTVSAESKNQMNDLIKEIHEKQSESFQYIGQVMEAHYETKEREAKDVEMLFQSLSSSHKLLQAVREKGKDSVRVISKELENFALQENILMMSVYADLAHYDRFLNFIHEISGLTTSSKEWMEPFREAVEGLGHRTYWVNLLVNIQKALDTYTVWNDVTRFPGPTESVKQCIVEVIGGNEFSQCHSFEGFLKQVLKNDFEYTNVRNIKPNIYELMLLKELLDFHLDVWCDRNGWTSTLTFKGRYVKFSSVHEHGCSTPISTIKIFASKKVFIDAGYRNRQDEIVVLAPTWEVIGSHIIDLNGENGEGNRNSWMSGAGYWYQGLSGRDGGEGGLFWGMAQNCENCEHLRVSANGGRGSDGRKGEDGRDGRDFHLQYDGDQDGVLITVIYNRKVDDIICHGESGGNGGRGGDGGRGGPKGHTKFQIFGSGSKPELSAVAGVHGTGGAGGKGGRGGRSERRTSRVNSILIVPWWSNEVTELPRAENGRPGDNGITPSTYPPPSKRYSDPRGTLNYYIRSLQYEIENTVTDATVRKFLEEASKAETKDLEHHVGRRSVASEGTPLNGLYQNNPVIPIDSPYTNYNDQILSNLSPGVWISGSGSSSLSASDGFGASQMQNSLMLLDYLYRKTRKVKPKHKSTRHFQDDDYAHRMAYRAHLGHQ